MHPVAVHAGPDLPTFTGSDVFTQLFVFTGVEDAIAHIAGLQLLVTGIPGALFKEVSFGVTSS